MFTSFSCATSELDRRAAVDASGHGSPTHIVFLYDGVGFFMGANIRQLYLRRADRVQGNLARHDPQR
jgi:hypothetical protein